MEVIACARLGCCGFVPCDATLDDLVRIIGAAERGEVSVCPNVAAMLLKALTGGPSIPSDPPDCLTRREREVCSLVCEGLTNKKIAREINRSLGTVKNHVGSILTKLDVPRRDPRSHHPIDARFVATPEKVAARSAGLLPAVAAHNARIRVRTQRVVLAVFVDLRSIWLNGGHYGVSV